MNKIVNYVKKEFNECNDLICKEIRIKLKKYYVIYLETISSSDKVNSFILNGMSFNKNVNNINKSIPSPNFVEIKKIDQINYYLCNGYTIIINKNNVYGVETKAELDRSISEATTEPNLYGPKDSFVENIQKNLGLIKRRLKTNHLKNKVKVVGRNSKSIINILYIDNIANNKFISEIENKLDNIDIDGVLDSGMLKKILDDNKNPFPTIKTTERPDTVCSNLLNGKVCILVDGSPYSLILPTFLLDFFTNASDAYAKSVNVIFIKILRILCFILSVGLPGYYIAITTYNQETIPLPLLLNFATQRSGVPFPPIVEGLTMLIICEILKESDLRFPHNYGSAISILGALILGEAAVNAGLVSPIMIIVVAMTFISSLLFTDTEISGAIRVWRTIFLTFSTFFGLYGISLSIMLFLINITSYKSMYINYTFPIEPNDKNYLKKIVFGTSTNKRSKYLTNNTTKSNL